MLSRLAMVLFVSLAAQPACAANLRSGDYLKDEFLQALRATQSPFHALREAGQGPQSIKILAEPRGLRFIGNLNWHEGWFMFTLTSTGKVLRGEDNLDYPAPQIDSDRHFRFNEGGRKDHWHGYSWVGDADREVVRSALAGRYGDASGRFVEFGRDGLLRGLGAVTPYWLDNDHIGNPFDYFFFGNDRTKPQALAFAHRGTTLILYPLLPPDAQSPSIGTPDYKHPKFTLNRLWQPENVKSKIEK